MWRTRSVRGFVVATAVVALVGCGGGAGSSASTGSSAGSQSGASSAAPAEADASTVALAKTTVLTADDFGPNYVVDDQPKVNEISSDNCRAQGDSPLRSLPNGASQLGPRVHFKDTKWFIGSSSTVFGDEAAAKAFIAVRTSDSVVECTRKQIEQQQRTANPQLSVVTKSTTIDTLGTGGFEAYTLYQLQFDDGSGSGVRDANGQFLQYAFRKGRVVITIGQDVVSGDTDPADIAQTVADDLNRAVKAALARIPA